jgi:hypothetical protein
MSQFKLTFTPEEHAARRLGLGGSESATVMVGSHDEVIELWRQKTPYVRSVEEAMTVPARSRGPDLSGVLAVQMGIVTEDFGAYWFSKVTGRPVTRRGEMITSKRHPWLRASLDGVTTTVRDALPAYVDFKHLGQLGEREMLRYTPQGVHSATILDLDWWLLSCFIGNRRHEVTADQEVDPIYQRALIQKTREFWRCVERDEEPPDTAPRNAPKPAPKLREIVVPTHIDSPEYEALARQNNWLDEMLAEVTVFGSTHAAAIKHAIVRERIKAIVPEDVGLVSYGLFTFKRDRRGVTIALAKGEEE